MKRNNFLLPYFLIQTDSWIEQNERRMKEEKKLLMFILWLTLWKKERENNHIINEYE